jgi:hypothetical protein
MTVRVVVDFIFGGSVYFLPRLSPDLQFFAPISFFLSLLDPIFFNSIPFRDIFSNAIAIIKSISTFVLYYLTNTVK